MLTLLLIVAGVASVNSTIIPQWFGPRSSLIKINETSDVGSTLQSLNHNEDDVSSNVNVNYNINMYNIRLDDEHIEELKRMAENGRIQSLSVANCYAKSKPSISMLFSMLTSTSNCKYVAFKHCNLDDQSLERAASLFANTNLISLDFTSSAFNSRGFRSLCAGMRSLTCLRSLVLDGCSILKTSQEARSIVRCLRLHPSISHISLSSCGIDDEGIEVFIPALQSNTNLTHIDLSKNDVSADGIETFVESISFLDGASSTS